MPLYGCTKTYLTRFPSMDIQVENSLLLGRLPFSVSYDAHFFKKDLEQRPENMPL